MSLVEKALRKLQESAPRVAQASAPAQQHAQPAVRDRETGVQHVTPPATPARSVFLNVPALRAAGVLPPEHEERKLAQQYRQIKRPLILNATGRGTTRIANGHLIMVASAMPGEGKTFTAMNLALSMSIEKDVHVLLVDADVAKPHITHLLGLSEAPGLLDVLREPALDVEGLILATDVPNLFVLPAGTPSAEATELLASVRMEQVIRALGRRDQQCLMLFDSPPLLQTTESRAISHVAGQIVVVVRAGSTPQQVLLDALSYLSDHPAVSLVLNQSMTSSPDAYYQGGYGDSRPAEAQPQPLR